MGYSIRPAAVADLAAITAIYAGAVRHGTATFEIEPPDEAEMRRRFDVLSGGGFPYFVAEEAGAVIGYAYAGTYRPRPAYRFVVEDSIYLAAEARGRGIGKALLNVLIEDSTRRGFRQMIAVIGDSANAASIGLHAACGFAMSGTFYAVGWKFGRWLDSVQMQLPLGEGSDAPAPSGR
jgi:L-amino acid N-acyltransferase YncA